MIAYTADLQLSEVSFEVSFRLKVCLYFVYITNKYSVLPTAVGAVVWNISHLETVLLFPRTEQHVRHQYRRV